MNTLTVQKKDRRVWVDTDSTTTDNAYIYRKLANALLNKYVYKSKWIKRIEYNPYYDSENKQVIVTYDNGYRDNYVINI